MRSSRNNNGKQRDYFEDLLEENGLLQKLVKEQFTTIDFLQRKASRVILRSDIVSELFEQNEKELEWERKQNSAWREYYIKSKTKEEATENLLLELKSMILNDVSEDNISELKEEN